MAKSPSLVSLCMQAVKALLVCDDEDDLCAAVWELPCDLLDVLVTLLPPLALQNLQEQKSVEYLNNCQFSDYAVNRGRKRKRCDVIDMTWKSYFGLRWPELVKQVQTDDWRQKYWEAHLQNCLDEAAEIASLPSFNGSLGEVRIKDSILEYIGSMRHKDHLNLDCSKLSYHCLRFGYYSSCLRLQNVHCVAETCQLLRKSKLQGLVVRWIRTKEHVDGLCKLLTQNNDTLTSLEFIHCNLSTSFVNAICVSLRRKSRQIHGIQHFSVHLSNFLENNLASLPSELITFLSSGRSLHSLKLRDNRLGRNFATLIFSTLIDASTGISCLDFSENNISGWLSMSRCEPSSRSRTSLEKSEFLRRLQWLNLRGNNLRKDDAENLSTVLCCLPNLRFLDLSKNPLKDDGIRCLIPYFTQASQKCFKLTDLRLGSCEISCNGMIHLLDALSTLERAPSSLDLGGNYLGSEVAVALGNFLGTSICVLNIVGIGLGSSGFKKLQEGVAENLKQLEKINISSNRGGIETAMFLCTLLSRAPKLTEVDASYNLMPVESLNIICSGLRVAKGCLELLDLTGNNWEYQPAHASLLTEFQQDGKPILILPPSSSASASSVPLYDADP